MNPESLAHTIDTLDNGLKVVVVPLPHLHAAHVLFRVRCGSRFETSSTNGISHFVEHMIASGGSARIPGPKEIDAALEDLGAVLDSETSDEVRLRKALRRLVEGWRFDG